jgi:type II secretory ATPase GspE/PulE/Tfp pilus assembly ATPase PilB-like protein
VPREYPAQCWSCLGEFDAAAAVWCTCSIRTPTKLCPFCFHCFCQADAEYQEAFWSGAPEELTEERAILRDASGTVGETLIRSNLLNTDQLVSALRWEKSRGVPLEQALVDLNFVTRDNLELVSRGAAPSGAAVDLSHQLIDATLVSAISVDLCYRKRVLPISKEEIGEKAVLTLAMAGPTDVDTIDQIQTLTNCRIIPMSVSEKEILDRLKDLFPKEFAASVRGETAAPAGASPAPKTAAPAPRPAPAAGPRARRGRASAATRPAPSPLEELEEIEPVPEAVAEIGTAPEPEAEPGPSPGRPAPPRPRPATAAPAAASSDAEAALQKILTEALSRKASMAQVEIRGTTISLFLRIDGSLFRVRLSSGDTAADLSRAIASRAGLPAGARLAIGRFPVKAGTRKIEVVVRRTPFAGGESLLLKIVEPSDFLRSPEDLGMSSLDADRVRHALSQPRGLVLLSAPPHNGVEVTRYSLIAHLAREGRRVFSVESPSLLTVDGARQQEIPPPPDPAQARAATDAVPGTEVVFLPDIVASGMAVLAVEKAASCLVVASIQARRASQVPGALLWHKVDAPALGAEVKLVLNQRLVRRVCEGCRGPVQVADRVLKMMGLTPDEALDLKVHQGSGCERCGGASPGYAGRVSLFEVLEGTAEIGGLIASSAPPGEIEREARRAGMSPLRAACLARVGQGVTTLEEFQKGNF